jgi:cellulose synthase operon protein C
MLCRTDIEYVPSPSAGDSFMSRLLARRWWLVCLLMAALFSGCSRDPNVRKQKYFESGQRYFAEGKYAEAEIQYSNAIRIDPNFAPAHDELGKTYLRLGDFTRAYQELTRTVELAPDNYRAHTDLANLLITARNPDDSPNADSLKQARSHLDLLREKQPNSAETHEAWSNYYAVQNNVSGAIQEMQQAIAIDPNRSQSYLVLGLLQQSEKLNDEAERSYNDAIRTDPKAMNAQLALGAFYEYRNRLPEAEQQFKHAIDIDPKDPGPRIALSRLLMQEGKKAETESFLQRTKNDLPNHPQTYRMLGDYYFATGDVDKATAEYDGLYRDHPKDPLVKRNYIQLLILKNRLAEATRLDDQILKSSPRDTDALVYKGQIQIRQNHPDAAVDTLQSALQNDPDNAVAHYQLGLAFDHQHDGARAEAEWRKAVKLRPDLTDAQRSLASLELLRGDSTGLLETSQQIIKSQPYAADGFLFKCLAEMALKNYSDAQHDAEEGMQRAPQSPAPYVQMGNVQFVQKHYPDAEKYFQQALDKDPSSADGLSGLMNTYNVQKQFDKAIAAANAQIAKSPNNSNFYDFLGTALLTGKKDLPGAEAALHKAIDLDKNNTDALEKLGQVQVQQGATDQALALYQQSIKDNPREPRFYILSGVLYESKQSWDQAKAMYRRALSIQPDQPLASNNLAYMMLEEGGNVDVALAMAETARRGMPDSPNAADTLGWAYYQKGVYQSAISQFQEALRLGEKVGAPDDPVLHYHLGLAYQKANQTALARQHLEKALKLSPNYADARKALSELRG